MVDWRVTKLVNFKNPPQIVYCFLVVVLCVWGIKPIEKAWGITSTQGSIGLESLGYRDSNYTSLQGKWKASDQAAIFETSAEVEFLYTFNHSSFSYLEIPESYAGTSTQLSFIQILAGRKQEVWNHLDDYWNLGIWQPRFRWDYLNPEKVGLIGGFVRVNLPYFQFVGFASPAFLPERGVNIDYQDGRFTSLSPWFIGLPTQASFNNVSTPIRYQLIAPSVGEIVSHPGVSFLMRAGNQSGFWGAAAFALKPMNQLLIGYDGILNLSSLTLDVNLYPRVLYHQLYSLEAGYSFNKFGSWISLLKENPLRDVTPSTWTTQELSDSLAASCGVNLELLRSHGDAVQVGLAYLRQWEKAHPDLGPFVTPGVNSFESRYPFQNALSFKFKAPVPWASSYFAKWSSNLIGSLQWFYDFESLGTLFSTQLKFSFKNHWAILVGADIVSSDKNGAQSTGADFISRYRANDRFYTGVSYAF